jgi:hypothetical protein
MGREKTKRSTDPKRDIVAKPYIDRSGSQPVLIFPKRFLEAHQKYCFPEKYGEQDLARRQKVCQDFEKGILPVGRDQDSQFKPFKITAREFWRQHVEETKSAIYEAFVSNDARFLRRLYAVATDEASRRTKAKRPYDCTAEALAIFAFLDLTSEWEDGTIDGPTKKQIRAYVAEHFPISITEHHWRRIFRDIGLNALPADM